MEILTALLLGVVAFLLGAVWYAYANGYRKGWSEGIETGRYQGWVGASSGWSWARTKVFQVQGWIGNEGQR